MLSRYLRGLAFGLIISFAAISLTACNSIGFQRFNYSGPDYQVPVRLGEERKPGDAQFSPVVSVPLEKTHEGIIMPPDTLPDQTNLIWELPEYVVGGQIQMFIEKSTSFFAGMNVAQMNGESLVGYHFGFGHGIVYDDRITSFEIGLLGQEYLIDADYLLENSHRDVSEAGSFSNKSSYNSLYAAMTFNGSDRDRDLIPYSRLIIGIQDFIHEEIENIDVDASQPFLALQAGIRQRMSDNFAMLIGFEVKKQTDYIEGSGLMGRFILQTDFTMN